MRPATRFFGLLLAVLLPMGLVACERSETPSGVSDEGDRSSAIQPDSDERDDTARRDDTQPDEDDYIFIRVCSYNIEDLRYDDILAAFRSADNEGANRARDAARLIAALDPDILLVNEIEFDFISAEPLSGQAFAQLVRQQRAELGMQDREYSVFQEPSNTGVHSGFDLNRDGVIDPVPGSSAYANDSWGYGEFPGHYAMAMFVAEPLSIDTDQARTFRKVRWSDMPDALLPMGDGETVPADESWYSDEVLEDFPLSSKSHWDVPVRLEDGTVIRILASHPTPPVFDGPEDRNGRRNHDEIRFWAEYLSGAEWIRDDEGNPAPAPTDPVVLLGDLNADPIAGDSLDDPVTTWILRHPRLNGFFLPESTIRYRARERDLRTDATARFGLRVDYVVPSKGILVARGGVIRGEADLPYQIGLDENQLDSIDYDASDHFPVWLDIRLPDAEAPAGSDQ
jgi:hypothetical protein